MFGKLTLSAIPYDNMITISAVVGSVLLGLVIMGLITYYRKWTYLYQEWLTSLDHKKIGIMYIILALVMLLRGFSDAILMRGSAGRGRGRLPGLSGPGALQSDIQRPRLDHDRLHGHAVSGRVDEYRRAPANRGPRCRLSLYEFAQSLANHRRGDAGHGIFGCG